MQSESRLERRTLGSSDNQVTKDYQDTSDNDILYNTITMGVAALTGYGLLKSGALKPITKPLLELADTIAKEGTNKASNTMRTIKQWKHLRHLSPTQAQRTQAHLPPTRSIFRERDTSLFFDLFEDLTSMSGNRQTNFHNMRQIMNDTVQDMQLLTTMIKENQDKLAKHRTDFLDTDFHYRMSEYLRFKEEHLHSGSYTDAIIFSDKAMQEFIETMTLSADKAAQELRESGYKRLTFGDITEIAEVNGVRQLVMKQGAQIDLNATTNKQGQSVLDIANNFFKNNRYGGNQTIFSTDVWKDIMIDPNMRIDKKGNIIDYRMSFEDLVDFTHSLSNDFRIPLVKFNPAKMIGLDKFGRKKPLMGILSPKQFDPNITRLGGQGDNARLGQWMVDNFGEAYRNKNVSVINGKAYVVDENNQLKELGSGLKLHDITYANERYGLKPRLNSSRQVAGLSTGEIPELTQEQIDNLTKSQRFRYKVGQIFDLGRGEIRPGGDMNDDGLDTLTSIDAWQDKLWNWLGEQKPFWVNGFGYDTQQEFLDSLERNNFKTLFGEGLKEYTVNGRVKEPRMYATSKEGFNFFNAAKLLQEGNTEEAKHEAFGTIAQYFVGRNSDDTMHEFFTEDSGWLFTILNALNEGLTGSSRLLGLSTASKKSSLDLATNLLLKRALPVYMLTKVPGMLNYFSEPFFGGEDETGNRDNISKFLLRDVVRPIDIGAHHAMDFLGATRLFKFLEEMVPGSDQINELPGIYHLGLGQTAEEREEYIESGVDPIRKGRWWGSGNTPFTGGKIMYFRPNIYRRVEADVDFSDSKWGSRQEYYNNTWFPNPVNPLAPLNHFVFDRNHYDKKHYYDRPYLQTAPEGQNIPIIGPLFGSTIGKIINPPTKMHLEYWQNGFVINPEDELPSTLLTEGRAFSNAKLDLNTFNVIQESVAVSNAAYQEKLSTSAYQAKQVISRGYIEKAGITFEERNILPIRTYDRYNTPYEVYSTPSGGLSVVDIPDEMNLYNVNQDLQKWSVNKVIGTNQRVDVIDEFQGPGIPVGNDSPAIDNAFMYGLGEQFNVLSDIAGLKGFALQAFVTGEANERARVIEDSGYAYSFNNDFWEANLGGLGGGLSEITRRFIPKRNNKTEYVNPIRNTMPSWMPGSNYFTDFKHGDPYSKIDNGEERLPGEGYERLHNIKGLIEFNIGSSSIGYEQDYIVKHMLKADKYTSSFEKETLKKGNEIHTAIGQSWLDAGLAINLEGKVEDKRNGIIGWYDALVHDMSSPTGVAIVDIKSTSAKKLEELRKAGKPLTHHMRQTNYYLWATGNTKSKGYIHYVDKENPDNTYTVGFDYSQKELETTLNNVYAARKTIRDAVERGEIGRGELYSTLDRFRILADVAPYSQEFKDVSAQLASEDLTPEEQKEASAIRDRITQQKEPLRVYPYKFKTANLKSETVTVSKIIDNNTIITKEYGKQHAIKFAGINVSESNTEYYKKWKEEYTDSKGRRRTRTTGITRNDAARREINRYIKPGARIQISYDADERNKYSKDSTSSIRAVVHNRGTNVNRLLLSKGHAKEKEDDDSPAAINTRYTKGEIAFGSAMETLTHSVLGNIPFVGSKIMQVRSPYEQYRKREVYSKDFQSWNHPIRDILIPHVQENIANNSLMGIGGIIAGGYIGRLFGNSPYGKLVGTVVGASVPAVGKLVFALGSDSERDWRPKRRREQEKLNEYVDTLKYVKNMRLYEQYKTKAMKEDNFDVERFMKSKEAQGVKNQLRQRELTDFKKKVKLDFKHRDRYNFKYGEPKYVDKSMSKKETISAINKEISEIQGQRKVTKIPVNALKAIQFKQNAEQTMYGYDPGDSLVDIMKALPKKERQYFKHFMDAPEEEKEKILRIAPSYLRRALQSSWGMPVDKKPSLDEYFRTHGLPDASWIGWDESTNIEDVKVKLVHQNKLDPGEFDIWDSNQIQADQTNIPIPKINAHNNPREVQMKLSQILGKAGYDDIQMNFLQSSRGNNTSLYIKRDARQEVSNQINELEI